MVDTEQFSMNYLQDRLQQKNFQQWQSLHSLKLSFLKSREAHQYGPLTSKILYLTKNFHTSGLCSLEISSITKNLSSRVKNPSMPVARLFEHPKKVGHPKKGI